MALALLTDNQASRIVSNVQKVLTSNDMSGLNKQAYNFLYLASGFIAHYNHYGFIAYYKTGENLAKDIRDNQAMNQWYNFGPGDEDYDYYMQKRDIYNRILAVVKHVFPAIYDMKGKHNYNPYV